MPDAPQGTICFLFTDIVGSTRLWEKFPQAMRPALARHDRILHEIFASYDGYVFKTVGDAFCVAFADPRAAVSAAMDAQRRLAAEDWGELGALTVRMGVHIGPAEFRSGDYFGTTLNRTSRIEGAACGGQILLSQVTIEMLEDEGLEGVTFKSLGSHRLRNLDRPEHLFQVVASGLVADFPPPRSMDVLPNNLPVQTTSFIGRTTELEAVQRHLENTRLLTLMGTGGTGKTRLAIEAAARMIHNFRDGAWLVELATVSNPGDVPETVGQALGVRAEAGRPMREAVEEFLRGKNLLLVLDNCEHLIAAVSQLVGGVIRSGPRVRVLATSRHALGIPGEVTLPVQPLGIFDTRIRSLSSPGLVDRLLRFDAVRLFVDRATAVRPDFAVTESNARSLADICSRLDGIPLAIELAAARVRVLDLPQIAARLDDRFRLLRGSAHGALPHQQTLQALIDWSHDLLSDKERILFRRLGVFTGGRTLEALEAVCAGDGLEEIEILDLLGQLVDKSLVTVERDNDGPRYALTESVWHYAREKLSAAGECDRLRDRHLDYYLGWAERAAPALEGTDQREWLDRCHREWLNLRNAIRRAIETRQADAGLRLLVAVYRAVEIRGNLEEARTLAAQLIALPQDDVPPARRASAWVAIGRFAWAADCYDDALRHYAAAREIYEELGDEAGSALTDMLRGFIERGEGKLDDAEHDFQRCLEVGRRLGSIYIEAGALTGLGSIALDRGDLAGARKLKEQSLAQYRRLGDHWIAGLLLWGVTDVALAQRDFDAARCALDEWTRIARDLGNRWILPHILECHAALALANQDGPRAARLLGATEALREHFNSRLSPQEQTRHAAALAALRDALPAPEIAVAWEFGRRASPWDVIDAG